MSPDRSPIYHQLNHHNRQIRILRLLPGPCHSPIQCQLHTAFLDDQPQYEALSYAWGDPNLRYPVVVDDIATNVTLNLTAALTQLRHLHRHRDLWVDALCINQADTAEKTHQVNLMKEIYSSTSSVILWLGAVAEDSLAPGRCSSAVMTRRQAFDAFQCLTALTWEEKDFHTHLGLEAEWEAAMSLLFRLPWWRRIWTIQEATLPKRGVLMCGPMQIPWESLPTINRMAGRHLNGWCCRSMQPVFDLVRINLGFYEIAMTNREKRDDQHFLYLLKIFRNRLASDPRDKLYALSGLAGSLVADTADDSILTLNGVVVGEVRDTGICFAEESAFDLSHIARHWQDLVHRVGKTGQDEYPGKSETYEEAFWRVLSHDLFTEPSEDGLPITSRFTFGGRGALEAKKVATTINSAFHPDWGLHCFEFVGRRYFTMSSGLIGLADPHIQSGDVVCVFYGGDMPFVVRPAGFGEDGETRYEYVSHAYVHGMMNGEATELELPDRLVSLV